MASPRADVEPVEPAAGGWARATAWLEGGLARSDVALAALVTIVAIGTPLLLARSLWVDASLYDVAARVVQRGGVHYRDVFDPNLPGMLWCHLAVRALFGWSHVALRLVDLVVFSLIVARLVRFSDVGEAGRVVRVWLAVLLFLYYFSLPEIDNVQRDVWMLLPALWAASLRVRQLDGAFGDRRGAPLAWGLVEGALWAAAFALKPFVALPAAACYLLPLVGRERRRTLGRSFGWSSLGVLAGGIAGLVVLVAWLRLSGSWDHYLRLLSEFAPEYGGRGAYSLGVRYDMTRWWLRHELPWCLAIGVALWGTARGLARPDRGPAVAVARALFLGWIAQALVLQPRLHAYALTPVALLAMPLAARELVDLRARRRVVATLVVLVLVALARHPMARQLGAWPRAVTGTAPLALRVELSVHGPRSEVPDWTALQDVAAFLQARSVGDREVLAYHDSTHPLYLELDVLPPVRYLHFNLIRNVYLDQHPRVMAEIAAAPLRYVVSDLVGIGLAPDADLEDPEVFRSAQRWLAVYPWDQPVIYRRGRYVVHRVVSPPRSLR